MTSPDEQGAVAPGVPPLTRRALRERRLAQEAAASAAGPAAQGDATALFPPAEQSIPVTETVVPAAEAFAPDAEEGLGLEDELFGAEAAEASEPTRVLDLAPPTAATAAKTRRRMKPAVKWSILSLVAVIVIGLGYAAAYAWNLWNSYNSQVEVIEDVFAPDEDRPEPLTGAAEGAQTILLLGSDIRGELEELDEIAGSRSDTIMVAHIPADREGVVVMSIMRDNWVEIPGHGEHKINAAMALGGIPLVVQTVESFIGTRIDHVAVIDFEGFKGVTEALGGVTVDNPRAFRARSGERFEQGKITLEGDAALAFVRERYAFPDGDYTRARNQQLFIKGVLGKVLSAETLTSPTRISALVGSIAPYMKVDGGLNVSYIAALGLDMKDVRAGDVTFFTSPTLGTGTARGQSIVRVDWDELEKVRTAFRAGTLNEYEPPER